MKKINKIYVQHEEGKKHNLSSYGSTREVICFILLS